MTSHHSNSPLIEYVNIPTLGLSHLVQQKHRQEQLTVSLKIQGRLSEGTTGHFFSALVILFTGKLYLLTSALLLFLHDEHSFNNVLLVTPRFPIVAASINQPQYF
jgi:hypothetical protein